MSKIVTYYSYKGGVGRTMALANTAVLLSKWGYRVLMIDWDLEAPGLEHFFKEFIDINIVKEKSGVIDLLQLEDPPVWQDALIPIRIPQFSTAPIHFISSGKRDENYFKRVRAFDIDHFYQHSGAKIIESWRTDWNENYDFVLIDSRTGITEIGGICLIQLPDFVVLLFTATEQGFAGTLDVARRASIGQQGLPFDRAKLQFLPVLTKLDTQAEFKLSNTWILRFAEELKDIYKDWLPLGIRPQDFIEATKVPYVTYFSFGEKLPVLEQSSFDPTGLAYAYENIAGMVANELDNASLLFSARDRFIPLAEGSRSLPSALMNGNKNPIRIFVSSSQDKYYVDRLLEALDIISKRIPLEVWSIRDLQPDDHKPTRIKEAIIKCEIALFVISDRSIDADDFELDLARSLGRVILPLWFMQAKNYPYGQIREYVGIGPETKLNVGSIDIFISIMEQLGSFLVKFKRSK
jgi:hypothetical protein